MFIIALLLAHEKHFLLFADDYLRKCLCTGAAECNDV